MSAGGAGSSGTSNLGGAGLGGGVAQGGRGGAASGGAAGAGVGGNGVAGGASGGTSSGGLGGLAGSSSGGETTGGSAGAGAAGSGAGAGMGGTGGSGAGDCDATSLVARMKIGWNLGNSLDVFDSTRSDTEVETAWGNPRITPELLDAVKAAGFGAVRIPVTWIGRFGAGPDYTLSAPFVNRVEEVVNYALERELYVIINLHHDGGEGATGQWISLVDGSGQATEANAARVLEQFKKIWAQVAAHFASYDEQLLFEGMNEVKVGYDTPLPAYLEQINALNQAFVDTVRATGGKNSGRCLVVPGYNTNIEHTVSGFVKPTDTSPGKLILSDHYYDPWSFAGEGSTQTWGADSAGRDDWAQEDWVRSQVAKLKTTFIDQGLPMIIGEYGAIQQDGYEEYRRYYVEYVTKAFHDAGIAPFVWDNGALASGAEGFGLINRNSNSVEYPDVLAAMQRAVTSSYALGDVEKP